MLDLKAASFRNLLEYLMIKLLDYYIHSLMKFFNSGDRAVHTVGFVAGRISLFFSVPILLNLLSVKGFILGIFNYEIFPEFWQLLLIILVIFFVIDRYVTRFIMAGAYAGNPPKYAFEILFWYIIATIALLFLSFIVIP